MSRKWVLYTCAASLLIVASILTLTGFNSQPRWSSAIAEEPRSDKELQIYWRQDDKISLLKNWRVEELSNWKSVPKTERDPRTKSLAKWEGIELDKLVDVALIDLNVNQKARVDLIILKDKNGEEVFVPRAFTRKHSVILALNRNGESLNDQGPLYSIAPWNSDPAVQKEIYPVQKYFVPAIREIMLTSYRERFKPSYLKRRTNPFALRGERLFVRNCMSCHNTKDIPSFNDLAKRMAKPDYLQQSHQALSEMPMLGVKDQESVMSYIQEFSAENPTGTSSKEVAHQESTKSWRYSN